MPQYGSEVEVEGYKILCPGEALKMVSFERIHVIPRCPPFISLSPPAVWREAEKISVEALTIDFPKERLVDGIDGAEALRS